MSPFTPATRTAQIRPVEPAVALRLLLGHRQGELMDRQERIMVGWQRLAALLPPAFDGARPPNAPTASG